MELLICILPHTSYAGLTMSLQQEWQFLQCVISCITPFFATLDESLRGDFLPELLVGSNEEVADTIHKNTNWGIKQRVIGIPEPIQTYYANFETSTQCCEVLNTSLLTGEALDPLTHTAQVKEGRKEGQERRVDRKEGEL